MPHDPHREAAQEYSRGFKPEVKHDTEISSEPHEVAEEISVHSAPVAELGIGFALALPPPVLVRS